MKTISYRGKNYRVQNANGWQHIIVTSNGNRQRIGLSQIQVQQQNDCVFDYILKGGFITHHCPAMDFWIYRHRMGNKISPAQFKIKFKVTTHAHKNYN